REEPVVGRPVLAPGRINRERGPIAIGGGHGEGDDLAVRSGCFLNDVLGNREGGHPNLGSTDVAETVFRLWPGNTTLVGGWQDAAVVDGVDGEAQFGGQVGPGRTTVVGQVQEERVIDEDVRVIRGQDTGRRRVDVVASGCTRYRGSKE